MSRQRQLIPMDQFLLVAESKSLRITGLFRTGTAGWQWLIVVSYRFFFFWFVIVILFVYVLSGLIPNRVCTFALMQRVCSFWLDPERTKEVKAHTAEATASVAALKSRKTRLRLKQPRFFDAPLGQPLHASSVRPVLLLLRWGRSVQLIIDDWELKIIGYGQFYP